jgi:hypothetical protein
MMGCVLLGSAASAKPTDAVAVDPALERLRSERRALCIEGVTTDLAGDFLAPRLAWIEQFLAAQLERSGFATVPSERVSALADRVAKETGGSFDSLTGSLDRVKRSALREAVRKREAAELGCDAALQASVEIASADFVNGESHWDHVQRALPSASGTYGWTDAFSLHIAIVATDGRVLLERWAGIQSAVALRGTRFQPISDAETLANDTWNAHAVLVGLGELAPPIDPALLPCLRDAFERAQHRSLGDSRLLMWATLREPGKEGRAACEARRFAFVPPARGEAPDLPAPQ